MTRNHALIAALAAVVFLFSPFAAAQATFFETEPNDLKSQASGTFVLRDGDLISGTSSESGDSDYWDVRTEAQPPGIYEHRLDRVAGTAADLSLRGLRQDEGEIVEDSDVQVQVASAGYLRWYGFGRSERVYLRKFPLLGGAETYTFRYTRRPVTAARLSEVLEAGLITIEGPPLTDLWVYDSELKPMRGYGNDNSGASDTQLRRFFSFEPGTYYLAITSADLSSPRENLANDQASPPDDTHRNGVVLEFPDAVAAQENTSQFSDSIEVDFFHGVPEREVEHPAQLDGSGPVHFVEFEVVPQNALPSAVARGTTMVIQPDATTPDLAVSGDDIYLVLTKDLGTTTAIGFLHSADRGQSFDGEGTTIPDSTDGFDPRIDADGLNIAVGFTRASIGGFSTELATSHDGGENWMRTTLTGGGFSLGSPEPAFGMDGDLSVVYKLENSVGLHEIAYQTSTDFGMTFGPATILSPPGADCSDPDLVRRGDTTVSAWTRIRPEPGIQVSVSHDGGNTWSPAQDAAGIQGAGGNARPRAAIAADGTLGVVFTDLRPGHMFEDAFFTQSMDFASFTDPVCVSRSPNRLSLQPGISTRDRVFQMLWNEIDTTTGTFGVSHSSVPAGSSVPPSRAEHIFGDPLTGASFPSLAATDDWLGIAYARGTNVTEVVLYTLSAAPSHSSYGTSGVAGEFGVPVFSVHGDLASGFTVNVGPAAPNTLGALALSPRRAAPVPILEDYAIEIDPAGLVLIGVMTDETGGYSLDVPFGLPSDVYLQAAFLDMARPLALSFPLGLWR